MLEYAKVIGTPATLIIILAAIFLICQVIGEILSFKGKVVPEIMQIRKHFSRRRQERMMLQEMASSMADMKKTLSDLEARLERNSSDLLSLLIDTKRDSIIGFASKVVDTSAPVTREQFKRAFKLYDEYDRLIEEHGLTNGETEVAIRLIQEAYEEHTRAKSFLEDVRGF